MLKKFKKDGFIIKDFNNSLIIGLLKRIAKKHFNKPANYYSKISRRSFTNIALKCQREIDNSKILEMFHTYENDFFKKITNDKKVLYTSGGYIRAVRPSIKHLSNNEYIGWHRETFYSKRKFINHAINVWIPILNVTSANSLNYIPRSHKIDDKKIIRRRFKVKTNIVKKLSPEHKLGNVYAPKKIISGVNLTKKRKFLFKKNQFVSFSTLLVHGNAQNKSDNLRIAYNFGIIGASKIRGKKKIDSKSHSYVSFD